MTYELAKQLQAAKYPRSDEWSTDDDLPTLEELIEACGVFHELRAIKNKGWRAYGLIRKSHRMSGEGSTPTEAVAKLWLALQAH